ncbi:coiled-coil domain-containing protein 112-like [Amyelois transitella]|uniref:coiled-coil domain-containing protein 112-like n=1 Tax=Amyelois transitella TaxID=680683 RepID=UPI00298F6EDF|nr:coiled-coil domain-containing protein 112-like [Amyelois transitella]
MLTLINVLPADTGKIIRRPKIKAKPFTDIVPSPVKNIITSPFKCQEVQQFQNFLTSYHRHGGWNEYSHNTFIQSWKKHFQNKAYSDVMIDNIKIEKSHVFFSEIIEKLPGVTKDDIVQHCEWYLEYLDLKRQQQEALNKWRANKKIIKKHKLSNKVEKQTEKEITIGSTGETAEKTTSYINIAVNPTLVILTIWVI